MIKLDKLISRKSSVLPEIVEENFFTPDEIKDIKEKIFNLKNYWEYLDPLNIDKDFIPVRLLSAGIYTRSVDEYFKNVKVIKPVMELNFFKYYEKIRIKLQEKFNLETNYSKIRNFPGFHIFVLGENQIFGKYPHLNFHFDRFDLSELNADYSISSFIIPISLPTTGGDLLYSFGKPKYNNRIDNKVEYLKFQYQIGTLIQWPGDLLHSIEPFELKENESRITLQIHAAQLKDKVIIFW